MSKGDKITKNTTDHEGNSIVQTLEVLSEELVTNYSATKDIVRSVIAARLELPDTTLDDVATLVMESLEAANLIKE